jgi:hypothetical protein
MDHSTGHIPCAGSTACSEGLSVMSRSSTATQIICLAQGRDSALPDPQFGPPSLSYRSNKIVVERELLPRKSTMPAFYSVSAADLPICCR